MTYTLYNSCTINQFATFMLLFFVNDFRFEFVEFPRVSFSSIPIKLKFNDLGPWLNSMQEDHLNRFINKKVMPKHT